MSPFRPDIPYTEYAASHSPSQVEKDETWLDDRVAYHQHRIALVLDLIQKAKAYMYTFASIEPGLEDVVVVLQEQLELAKAQLTKESAALSTGSPVGWGNVWPDFNLEWDGCDTLVINGAEGKPKRSFKLPTTPDIATLPTGAADNRTVGAKFAHFASELVTELTKCERSLWTVPDIVEHLRQARFRSSEDRADVLQKKMKNISLLGEYNEVKDIGQQLIGLVAENRGVPVGTFYEDSQYGVDAKD